APISTVWEGANAGWWPVLWFLVKMWAFIFFFVWLRGSLPRVRYDQLMRLGWKVLMPASLGWILLVATVRALRNEGYDMRAIALYAAIVAGVVLVATLLWETLRGDGGKDEQAVSEAPAGGGSAGGGGKAPAAAAGFPVPPMDAPHYHGRPIARS
ncbi:NADH-quinone oxidoreductase subunit H, partial [Actinomadura vinacea]|uniref:NADH-quinone oxidoreductase subunit H n=1 Tax=Actinomadura vinacea TaxID=115336 RepID=UPI0031DCFEAB